MELLGVWRHNKPKTKKTGVDNFKTTIIKQNVKIILHQNNIHVSEVHCGSAVRFSQTLLGYLITAHHLYVTLV